MTHSQKQLKTLVKKIARLIAPPPKVTVSQWADQYRQLSSESSAEAGQWKTDRAFYQKGMMDAFCDPLIETIVIMSSAQIGKTETLNNIIAYLMHLDPCPMLVLQPTLEMAETWSKDRLAPMLRDTLVLKGLTKDPRSRDSGNTLLQKRFRGGHITMAGANSPASLASRPVRLVLCDEVDRYPASAGGEGDPVNLAIKRTNNFWNRKIILTSTPTIKGASRIEIAFEQSDKRRFHVPCPTCGEFQVLKWSQVKWENDGGHHKAETAHYVCEHNDCIISDTDRPYMLTRGHWVAEKPLNKVAGFHINELYSPWVSFERIVTDFLNAKALPETLKTWVNTSLGEPWEEKGDALDADMLMKRRKDWGTDAPEQVVLITAGVDVQKDRLELELKGWGVGEECWSLDYRIFHGDPAFKEVWEDLDAYLSKSIRTQKEVDLNIACTFIDSGGCHTQAVYEFCSTRETRGIFAIKGSNQAARPIVGRPSKNNRYKLRLYPIGTDTAKELIYARLKLTRGGSGSFHFPMDRDDEYFLQLTAEKQITRYSKGASVREWVKTRSRNEVLDCTVYALAAFKLINPDLKQLSQEIDEMVRATQEQERIEETVSVRQSESWIPRMNNWFSR